jgi:hypothetical protein
MKIIAFVPASRNEPPRIRSLKSPVQNVVITTAWKTCSANSSPNEPRTLW